MVKIVEIFKNISIAEWIIYAGVLIIVIVLMIFNLIKDKNKNKKDDNDKCN